MRVIADQYPLDHLRKWHYILNSHPFWHKDAQILYGCEIDAALQYADEFKLTVVPIGIDRIEDFHDMVKVSKEACLHVDTDASNLSRSTLIHTAFSLYNYDIVPSHMWRIVNMFHPLMPSLQQLEKRIITSVCPFTSPIAFSGYAILFQTALLSSLYIISALISLKCFLISTFL